MQQYILECGYAPPYKKQTQQFLQSGTLSKTKQFLGSGQVPAYGETYEKY
jgi:hypothetical protein